MATVVLGSCDMMRSLAGRPTSADIAAKQELIAKHEQEVQQRLEAEEAARKREADSLSAVESIYAMDIIRRSSKTVSSLKGIDAGARYSLILGTFSEKANAEKLGAKVVAGGYTYKVITFRNGFCVVAACPSDDPVEFYSSLVNLRQERYCSKDAWILINE